MSRDAEEGDGWIAENDAVARSMPLMLGSVALVAVLLNRSLSGIAPVADASRFSSIFVISYSFCRVIKGH